jgi:hypothetical protein
MRKTYPKLGKHTATSSRGVNLDKLIGNSAVPPMIDTVTETFQPKTDLGKSLLALRRRYVANGGVLLNEKELDEEMRYLRGRDKE